MEFSLPHPILQSRERFHGFLDDHLKPHLHRWYEEKIIPREFFAQLGANGWLAFERDGDSFREQSVLQQAVLMEDLAQISPGVGVAVLVQISLGIMGLHLFGSPGQKSEHMDAALRGERLLCLGNTEPAAGSDVAGMEARAEEVEGGWLLNGTKAFVTNGSLADLILVTAVSDPHESRNQRISMFLVDLASEGITRRKLNKEVWIPSDLTRITFRDVLVPRENLVGQRGKGLHQVLEIFTHSRVTISALTLGTASGAFRLGVSHAKKRKVFGTPIIDFQAKSFQVAELYSRIEAARLMLWRACCKKDLGEDFRLDSSVAKFLAVEVAREAGMWAADLFGAASVMVEHPVHKFPMDAWAASLGEGTQDIQKLIIFREVMKGLP